MKVTMYYIVKHHT